jgi:hypothetical protein
VAEVVATEVEEAFHEEGWIEVDEDVEVQWGAEGELLFIYQSTIKHWFIFMLSADVPYN